jgi:hypothetical protein
VEKMKDKRSYEIKKILKKEFPNNEFKVRIDKRSFTTSIDIYTDAVKFLWQNNAVWRVEANANPTQEDYDEYFKYKKDFEKNKEIEEKIRNLVGHYEKIHYDEYTGEILGGGNTFVFIKPLNITETLKELARVEQPTN